MTSKQIHELLPVATLTAEDRIVVSTASGNLTRHATIASIAARMPGAGAVDRRISDKLSEAVSVRDFGAVGDGVANDAPAFEAALAAALAGADDPEARGRRLARGERYSWRARTADLDGWIRELVLGDREVPA